MHPLITSHQNPKIKNILALEKARERRLQNVFVIEGLKELSLAVEGKYKISSVFFCPEIVDVKDIQSIINQENLLIPVQQSFFFFLPTAKAVEVSWLLPNRKSIL